MIKKMRSSGTTENTFSTIQPISGTSPVADSSTDTLTLSSSDSSIGISGNSSTDSLDFSVTSANKPSRVTSDVTTTADTAGDVTGLGFAIAASEVWCAEFHLKIGCNNTGGVKFAITVPASATFMATVQGSSTSPSSLTTSILATSGALSSSSFSAVNSANCWLKVSVCVVNSTNAGSVQLQFASTTAGQTSTVYANSYVIARKIA